MTDPRHDTRTEAARRELDRLRDPGGGVLGTHLERGAPPGGIDETDPAEVWGRRIGRGAAVLAGIAALYYLFDTYIR